MKRIEELWLHKDSDMMVRYYFGNDKITDNGLKRTIQFGLYCKKYEQAWVGFECPWIGEKWASCIDSVEPSIFPDDFIKIGDV